jgi:dTDP-glucose 4,6-dehydratase
MFPGDISDQKFISQIISRTKPEKIIHLAAILDRLCTEFPEKAFDANLLGTYSILTHAKRNHVKHILFCSSKSVYDYSSNLPLIEESPRKAGDLYSYTKISAEIMVNDLFKDKIAITTFRPSTIYGFGTFVRWNEVPARFAKDAIDDKPLTLIKPSNLDRAGEQEVDLIHVRDLVQIIIKMVNSPVSEIAGETYNLCSSSPMSIREIVYLIDELSRQKFNRELKILEKESDKPVTPKIDISNLKAKNKFGWSPEISLKEGLNELMTIYHTLKMEGKEAEDPSLLANHIFKK